MTQAATAYRPSPVGVAVYPWLNKPDTKFNTDGVYKVGLVLEGEDAEKLRAEIDKAAEEAFGAEAEKMTAAERKKWAVYYPYDVEEDEEGRPIGRVCFNFKQNATLTLSDGTQKVIQVGLYDAKDKPTTAEVWGGALLRVRYRPRPIKMASAKKVGVRLDFLKVQIVQLAERDEQDGGFGEVAGGFDSEQDGAAPTTGDDSATPEEGSDF